MFTEDDLNKVSKCIEIAFKTESQKLNIEQCVQLGVQLDSLRGKLRTLVSAQADQKKP